MNASFFGAAIAAPKPFPSEAQGKPFMKDSCKIYVRQKAKINDSGIE